MFLSNVSDDRNAGAFMTEKKTIQESTPPSTSGLWVAAIMIGLLVLIVVVEMVRSHS
jgi:hypothetical protein